jgi:drug/metabolite transporter (DMT)-like permease
MTKNEVLKGVVLIALGATSYGMLATFVKLAYQEHFTTAEVTSAQSLLGILGVLIIHFFQKIRKRNAVVNASKTDVFQLILAGTSLGMTSVFYYLCVKYINVSIAIVLLMQTVWMGVLLEMILDRKRPSNQKTISVFVVLIGTVLATDLLNSKAVINGYGILWGLLAAASFTTSMFTSSKIAVGVATAQRSLYMLLGGAIVVLGFAIATQNTPYNFDIFLKWGLVLSLFGTVIPPMLMNAGFPKTGIGLGSIVSSLELPVSVLMAYFILGEKVSFSQWMGIVIIVLAVVIMNVKSMPLVKK